MAIDLAAIPSAVYVWLAALCALLLLVAVPALGEILASRRRDAGARLWRAGIYLAVPALVIFPALLVTTGHMAENIALLFYMVFFGLFCYYLGKRMGWTRGRRHIEELIGFDSPGSLEEVQDRLFESNMRYPNRADVVKSIGEMAKRREAESLERERQAAERTPAPAKAGAGAMDGTADAKDAAARETNTDTDTRQ